MIRYQIKEINMGMLDGLIEAIVAIIIVIVFFFDVLPEMAKITGFSVIVIYILGGLLLVSIVLSLLRR